PGALGAIAKRDVLALVGHIAVRVADLEQGEDDGLAVMSVRNAQRPRPDVDREPGIGAAEAHPFVGVRVNSPEGTRGGDEDGLRFHASILSLRVARAFRAARRSVPAARLVAAAFCAGLGEPTRSPSRRAASA